MEEKEKRAQEILQYPTPYKTRGFEEVVKEHIKHQLKDENGEDISTTMPTKGSKNSAGYDFYSKENIVLRPGEKHVFWTDVKSYMLADEVLKMYVRSSTGIKKDLILRNQTGIIDSDYYSNPDNDGNIGICLKNDSDKNQEIMIGERIVQGIFHKYLLADDIISEEERDGGIGSTNKK